MPVTLIVFPFLTQVIVFFLPFEASEVEAVGVGELLWIGELEGVGLGLELGTTISAALLVAEGVGVALAVAMGAAVGNKSLS